MQGRADLLVDETASAGTLRSLPIVGSLTMGRDNLKIADKRISRSQLTVTLSTKTFTAVRLGANPSFSQVGDATPKELARSVNVELPYGTHLYLARDPNGSQPYQYPVLITNVDDGNGASPSPGPAVAVFQPPPVAAIPPPVVAALPVAASPPGVWQVKLGGGFSSYAAEVQTTLEAAYMAGRLTCDVMIDGRAYTISMHRHNMRQMAAHDPTRTRPVRREGGPPAPPPAADPPPAANPPPAAVPPADPTPDVAPAADPPSRHFIASEVPGARAPPPSAAPASESHWLDIFDTAAPAAAPAPPPMPSMPPMLPAPVASGSSAPSGGALSSGGPGTACDGSAPSGLRKRSMREMMAGVAASAARSIQHGAIPPPKESRVCGGGGGDGTSGGGAHGEAPTTSLADADADAAAPPPPPRMPSPPPVLPPLGGSLYSAPAPLTATSQPASASSANAFGSAAMACAAAAHFECHGAATADRDELRRHSQPPVPSPPAPVPPLPTAREDAGQRALLPERVPPTASVAAPPAPSLSMPYAGSPEAAACTLALPLLSVGDFAYDVPQACAVALREAAHFLSGRPMAPIALLLVAPPSDADVMNELQAARTRESRLDGERRFAIASQTARLDCLQTSCGVPCRFVANPANHKLNRRGGGINRLLHAAAGADQIESLTRAAWRPHGRPGAAYPVQLPADNPLRTTQGVEWLLHVVGPNMNRDRPLCLDGDYATAEAQLAETYRALFAAFAQRATPNMA